MLCSKFKYSYITLMEPPLPQSGAKKIILTYDIHKTAIQKFYENFIR